MQKVLLAWLGMTDIRCAKGNIEGLGPIAMATNDRPFDQIYLLSTTSMSDEDLYASWLKQHTIGRVKVVHFDLSSPTDYGEIFEAAKSTIESLCKDREKYHLTFHLSPGTPAMSSVWMMLSKSLFPAELIESSLQQGVNTVSFPFELYVEYSESETKQTSDILALFKNSKMDLSAFSSIKYKSNKMKLLIARADRVAKFEVPVLIEGESGTGKELFARAIHDSSNRKDHPFIAVNCGAIPAELFESEFFGYVKGAFTGANVTTSGYIEAAKGGTLFLDEIGEMPLIMQVKLFRSLQQGIIKKVGDIKETKIDFRVVAATNRNLLQEVAKGNFREDLFHRLAVGVLNIPPIRKRREDLSLLIDHFISEYSSKQENYKNISISARNLMVNYPWPGNVRELQNTILRLFVWSLSDTITDQDVRDNLFPVIDNTNSKSAGLELSFDSNFELERVISELEISYIQKALKDTGGNKTKAAELLGIKNYQTLNNKIKKYKIL